MNRLHAHLTLRQIVVVVAGCALFCTLARLVGMTVLFPAIAVPAPAIEALIQRWRDGGGILGGVVEGMNFSAGLPLAVGAVTLSPDMSVVRRDGSSDAGRC
jgi:hypothetical protein